MTEIQIYDALCGLLPGQLEEVVLAAGVLDHHIPPSTVPTATRANALIHWMKQSPVNRENLIQALDRAQQRAGAARKTFILPPVDTEGFAGRKTELQWLTDLLINGTPPAGGRIVGVFGPPGVGKSGLAVHFAKTERKRFPGGVLGVDLRGVEDPADAISRFATAQGELLTPEEQVRPLHEIMQARFADRRCLLVLDNLEHGSALKQVKPGGQAAVLITCRNQEVLAQFAVPAANRIPLGALSPDDARQYLEIAFGHGTHSAVELDSLAHHVRYLPLALRIAARRLLEDPLEQGRIGRFLQRLRDADDPLGELVVDGEADLDLIRLFALSLEHLPEPSRRAFACLSACAPHDFGAQAAAAATGFTNPASLLARLTRLSLLEINQVTARYRFHPLIDDYARRLADRWSLAADARQRHGQAMTALLRNSADGEGEALLKLLEEQADIRHAIDYLVEQGPFDLRLLQGLNRLVEQAPLGRWHQEILEKARARLDPASQAWLNAVLQLQQGKRAISLGQLDEARQALEDSLEIGRRLYDERHEAMVLNSLGGVLRDLGRTHQARQAFEDSLEIVRRLRDERSEAMVLNSLGGVLRDLGRMDQARQALEDSLEIERRLYDERGEAMVLNSLGGVLRDLGRMDGARKAFEDSLEIARRLHDKRSESAVLNSLGWWFREQGDPMQALKALEEHRAIRRALQLPIPDVLRSELQKLRQWLKRLQDGTGRSADYHLFMARKRIIAKDWPGAIIHLQHNLAMDDSDMDRGERLENLAYAYFRAERRTEVISISKQALASGLVNARLCANLGRVLHLEGGCLEESEQFLRRSLELNPDNPWAWSWLGLVRADQGHLEEAETHARTALVEHEQHAVLIHHLALVLVHHPDERADKLEEALHCCEQAEKLADFPFPHPTQLAIELRQRLQLLGTDPNPSK